MRLFVPLILLLTQVPAMASEPTPAQPLTKPPCESRDLAFDSKEIGCSLRISAHGQRLRLTVNFSGGHDDTSAMMTLYLNDKALACDAGSKTRLMGEDGDVSLTCVFSIAARTQEALILRSVVSWSHAQYTGYNLETY